MTMDETGFTEMFAKQLLKDTCLTALKELIVDDIEKFFEFNRLEIVKIDQNEEEDYDD